MKGKTHIFAVGLEYYLSTKVTAVDYAENDAREFVKAWQALGVDPADCVILLSSKATQASIRSHLKSFLNNAQKEDTVIFFFAGHGVAFNDASYITTHDTLLGDLKDTSIPLAEILKSLKACRSSRILLFIDSCHSGLPISAGMRSITSEFSTDEMKRFCDDSEYHIAFASCKVNEFSWSNSSVKHGIWSHGLIEALKGNEKDALEKDSLITGDSLRDYLSDFVPRLLRKTRVGTATQTPCVFGNATKQFLIADLQPILDARAAKSSSLGPLLKDSSLKGVKSGSVRSLSGFQKRFHREPDSNNNATESFVRRVGAEEVKERADRIFDEVRQAFAFKKRDLNHAEDTGSATITTPDFDINIWVEQDSDDPSSYNLVTQVTAFRRPAVVQEAAFSEVFSKYCDTISVEFSRSVDVNEKIEAIEEISTLRPSLDYARDGSWLTLTLTSPAIRMKITDSQMTLSLTNCGDLKALFTGTSAALKSLAGRGISLLPSGK